MKDTSCKTPRWRMLKAQLNNLNQQAFKERLAQSDEIILLDVRTPQEFDQSHIPNAINIDYFDELFWERIDSLDKAKDLLVYCRTGRRSIRACLLMQNGGFNKDKVFNQEGGFSEWIVNFPEMVE